MITTKIKILIATIVVILCRDVSFGQTNLDQMTNGNIKNNTVLTVGHNVTVGNLLIATIITNSPISSVTYAGSPITSNTTIVNGSLRVAIYYLIDPPLGSTNLVVNVGSSNDIVAGVMSFFNVDTITPISGTAISSGSSNASTLILTPSPTYGIVVDVMGLASSNGIGTANSPQTEIFNGDVNQIYGASSWINASSPSDTTNWTLSVSKPWGMASIGINFDPDGLFTELISFKLTRLGENVDVSWDVAAENNNDYFIIEKSSNGLDWIELTRVKSIGDHQEKYTYWYVDTENKLNETYYRLIEVDRDGVSKVIVSEYTPNMDIVDYHEMVIFPNPSTQDVIVRCFYKVRDTDNNTIQIVDGLGKVVKEFKVYSVRGTNETVLDFSGLPMGSYTVRAYLDNDVVSKNFEFK